MPVDRKIIALVPAGQRNAADAVAEAAGVSSKVLAPLVGTPMIVRVLNALQATGRIHSVVLSGPDRAAVEDCSPLQDFINREDISWVPAGDGLSDSVQAGLARIDPAALVLIATADHALLDGEILNFFLDRVIDSRADVSVGLVDYALMRRTYPGVRRTVLKFSGGAYCGCNLYALGGARSRDIISLWQGTQTHRKRPWRMIHRLFGIGILAKYVSGRLSLEQARQAILEATGLAVAFIDLPFPRAGIDVDTLEDKKLVEEILGAG